MAPQDTDVMPHQDPNLLGEEEEAIATTPWYKQDLRELGWPVRTAAWTGIVLAAVFVLYLMVGLYGHIAIKYEVGSLLPPAITGRSMEPTIHQPIQIGSLSFGAIIWINREADRPVDSILLFRTPDGVVEAKRVEKKEDTRNGPRYWFATDNSGMTGEGSGFSQSGYTWIEDSNVIGRVVAVWSPRRTLRWFTVYGRDLNFAEFAHHPSEIFTRGREIVISCANRISAGNRQLFGWQADKWSDKTSERLLLSRQAVGKKEYALLDVGTWRLKTGVASDGSLLLSQDVSRQFGWGRVVGPLVYAMDDDRATYWAVGPATDNVSSSSIVFDKLSSGTLVLNGGGDAACRAEVLVDGKLSSGAGGSWNLLSVPFTGTRRIDVRQIRNESASSSGIGKAQLVNLSY